MTARAATPTVTAVNLAANLTATAARMGGKTALRHDDVAMSYRALDSASARMAALLARRAIQPGDLVGVLLPDVPAFAVVVYGALRVGAVVAVVDEGELAVRLAALRPRLLVAWHAMAEAADDAAQRVGTGCLFVMPGEFERLLRAVPADRAVRHRDDADVAVLSADGALTHGELRAAAVARGVDEDAIITTPRLGGPGGAAALHAAVIAGACLSITAGGRRLLDSVR